MDTVQSQRSLGAAEAEIDRFIERQAQKGETTADDEDVGYLESVRRFNEQRQQQIRAAWCEYHQAAAERHRRTLAALIAHHEGEAQKLLGGDAIQGEGGP